MHKLKNKGLLKFLKRGGKIWTSPPGGTGGCLLDCHYNKVCILSQISSNLCYRKKLKFSMKCL